jgi:hypothetical protein
VVALSLGASTTIAAALLASWSAIEFRRPKMWTGNVDLNQPFELSPSEWRGGLWWIDVVDGVGWTRTGRRDAGPALSNEERHACWLRFNADPPGFFTLPSDDELGMMSPLGVLITESAGFPFRALEYRAAAHETQVGRHVSRLTWGIDVLPPSKSRFIHDGKPIALPLRPIPVGFLADTMIFAALWWLMLITPGILRRRCRRKCGRCIRCGYDLAASPTRCPECGASD